MIKIISDTSCDLTNEQVKKMKVTLIPFLVSLDRETYRKERSEIDVNEFYKTLIDNPKLMPKTACPPVGAYEEAFLENINDDIICLTISQEFSGSYNSARVAREMVLEQHPKANITVIDSRLNTVAFGLLVSDIHKMILDGLPYKTILKIIDKQKQTGKIFFTTNSLLYLESGGRVRKVAAKVATRIQLMPILYMADGVATTKGVALGRNRSKKKVLEKLKSFFSKSGEKVSDYHFCVGYGYDREEGEKLADKLKAFLEELKYNTKIRISQIGSTVASHTGPHPIGIGFIKKYQTEV